MILFLGICLNESLRHCRCCVWRFYFQVILLNTLLVLRVGLEILVHLVVPVVPVQQRKQQRKKELVTDSRPCLLWGVVCIKYLMDSRKKDNSRSEYSQATPCFRPHSAKFAWNRRPLVVHFHWFRLPRNYFPILSYITLHYLHFEDVVSTALARSRHKNPTKF